MDGNIFWFLLLRLIYTNIKEDDKSVRLLEIINSKLKMCIKELLYKHRSSYLLEDHNNILNI